MQHEAPWDDIHWGTTYISNMNKTKLNPFMVGWLVGNNTTFSPNPIAEELMRFDRIPCLEGQHYEREPFSIGADEISKPLGYGIMFPLLPR